MTSCTRQIRKLIPILLTLSCLSSQYIFASSSVSVSSVVFSANVQQLQSAPRSIVNVIYTVENKTKVLQHIEISASLPSQWMLNSQLSPIDLESDETDTVFVSFLIPGDTLGGIYPVSCTATLETGEKLQATTEVVIPRILGLSLKMFSAPSTEFAGNAYQSVFLLQNTSNAASTVTLEAESSLGHHCTLESSKVTMHAGESRSISIQVQTNKKLTTASKDIIRLKALLAEDATISAQAKATVKILPSSASGSFWHKYPVSITWSTIFDLLEPSETTSKVLLSGDGSLNDKGNDRLRFSFGSPLFPYDSVVASDFTYTMDYSTSLYKIYGGKRSFNLSPLTTGSITGNGIGLELYADCFTFTTFSIEDSTAFSVRYSFKKLNYLEFDLYHDGQDLLLGTRGVLRVYDQVSLTFETVKGFANSNDYAFSVDIGVKETEYAYSLKFIRYGENFGGSSSDKENISAYLKTTVFSPIIFTFNYNSGNDNLDTDSTSIWVQTFTLGLSYRSSGGYVYTALYKNYLQNDLATPSRYSILKNHITLGFEKTWKLVHLQANAEYVRNLDFQRELVSSKQVYSLLLDFRIKKDLSILNTLTFDTGLSSIGITDMLITNTLRIQYVGFLDSKINGSFKTTIGPYLPLSRYYSFSVGLTHSFEDHGEFSMSFGSTYYADPALEDAATISFTYRKSLQVPVSMKSNIGSFCGQILDYETHKPIAQVIVTADKQVSVTDEDGNFSFPNVRQGSLYVQLDLTRLERKMIVIGQNPLVVGIGDKEKKVVEIELVMPASISGKIQKTKDLHASMTGFSFLGKTTGNTADSIPRILLNLESSQGSWRTYSDAEGFFQFNDLQPGTWNLTAYYEDMSNGYYLEKKQYQVVLEAGGNKEVELKLLPVAHPVIVMQEGGTLELE